MDTLMYKGIVLSNFDPNKLMRVKIFIPECSPQNCEWLKSRTNDQPLRYPGLPSLTKAEKDKLIDLLPWAEQCAPLMGESGLSRYHDPSGKQVPKATQVPQKQAQSNPPTRQKGGAQGRVTSTIQTEPGGRAAIPGRQKFASINDGTREKLFKLTNAEVGGQGRRAQIAFMETVANRAAAEGKEIDTIVSKQSGDRQYYEPLGAGRGRGSEHLRVPEQPTDRLASRSQLEEVFSQVVNNSNESKGATHNYENLQKNQYSDYDVDSGSPVINIAGESFYSKTFPRERNFRKSIPATAGLQPGDYGYVENQNTNVTDGFADGKYGKHNIYGAAYAPRNSGSETSGVYGIPQVGAHVWVFHRRGDINFPVYFGVSPGYKDTGLVFANDGSPDAFENSPQGPPDPASADGLDPRWDELKRIAKDKYGAQFRQTDGYRSQATQNELYASGRTRQDLINAGVDRAEVDRIFDRVSDEYLERHAGRYPGNIVTKTLNSKHISGLAIDVVWTGGRGINDSNPTGTIYDPRELENIARIFQRAGRDLGIEVTWGGDWRSFKDRPHLQIPPA